jgi:PAP2 superfamily
VNRRRVPNLELSWQQAAVAAGGLIVVAAGLRLAGRPRLTAIAVFTRETALVLGLFALWQFAGSFSVMRPDGALSRARWIWHLERVLHLPSETSLQRPFLPHPLIVQSMNLYYDTLHFPVLIACMIWLFVRHRADYVRRRTTLAALTGACLLIQLVPVAPPRMLPGTGLVDTAVLYHQSVAGFNADQLSAMPSIHIGWAILVAIMVISSARSRWRWLALLYPVMTTLTVVVTANHYWLDGIVAGLVLVVVLLAQAVTGRLAGRSRRLRRRLRGAPGSAWMRHAGTLPAPPGCSRCASPGGRSRHADICRTTPARASDRCASRQTGCRS